jgi:hypothetical protein
MAHSLLLSLLCLLTLCGSARAQSGSIPGWTIERKGDNIIQTSPRDAKGNAVIYVQRAPEVYVGSFGKHFEEGLKRLESTMKSVEGRGAVETEDWPLSGGGTRTLWKTALTVTNSDDVTANVIVFGYRVDTGRAQILLLLFDKTMDYDDPHLSQAVDNVADLWKAGRAISLQTVAAPTAPRPGTVPATPTVGGARPSPVAAPTAPPPAKAPAAAPCVPRAVVVNYPRAVSRQQCGTLAGRYQCTTVIDYVSNPVTHYTGCP